MSEAGEKIRRRTFDEEMAERCYKMGDTDEQIAWKQGCSVRTVQKWRIDEHLPPNHGVDRPVHPLVRDAVAARNAGMSYGQYMAQREQQKREAMEKRKRRKKKEEA